MEPVSNVLIESFELSDPVALSDCVVIEEPLEIFLCRDGTDAQSVSITMRTPGNDAELALGFLFSEGLISSINDVQAHGALGGEENAYAVSFEQARYPDVGRLKRNFVVSSSCGVCGKASLDAVKTILPERPGKLTDPISPDLLKSLPGKIQSEQTLFSKTGGVHAAALFNSSGDLLILREDVGRHNALDKLIGAALLDESVDMTSGILLLSGRTSFELMQKALMCRMPMVCSVGAPSSLAVELARENSTTLVGFLSRARFNVYSGSTVIVESSSLQPQDSGIG